MALKKASNAGKNPLVAAAKSGEKKEPPRRSKMLSSRVTPEVHRKLKMACLDGGITVEDAIEEAVLDWVKKQRRNA